MDVGVWPEDVAPLDAPFADASRAVLPHTDYQRRPLEWIVDRLGVSRRSIEWSANPGYDRHEWDGTPDPLVAILDALASGVRAVGVEAGTATGKTFLAACVTLWFLACWQDARVITVAPKQDQLLSQMWLEIGRLFPAFQRLFPSARLLHGVLRMREGVEWRTRWSAEAFVCGVGADEQSATRAQGYHARHMLIITEETPGIDPAIMIALRNTSNSPHNLRLALGNPDHEEDELHRFCLQPGARHIRISALDHPNYVCDDPEIVPGAVSVPDVEERRVEFRHTPALWQSRIQGISPKQAVGVALAFRESDHLETWPVHEIRTALTQHHWPVYVGIDFGHYRWSALVGVVSDDGRMHIVAEMFSQEEYLDQRVSQLLAMLANLGVTDATPVYAWGDSEDAAQIVEINRVLRERGVHWTLGKSHKRLMRGAEMVARSYRLGFVARANQLLGRKALLFSRDLGRGMEWCHGLTINSLGRPVHGSRLLWEIRRWRYPQPRPSQAQQQDPDDNTADGADAIAALRYLIMGWWGRRPPTAEERKAKLYEQKQIAAGVPRELRHLPQNTRNRDYGLERMVIRQAQRRRGRGGFGINRGF